MNFMDKMLFLTIDKNIYLDGKTTSSEINAVGIKIVKMVAGVGATCLTLAILIIALFIIFGSISSKSIGKFWVALFSCLGGALVFYSAYFFAPALSKIVGN